MFRYNFFLSNIAVFSFLILSLLFLQDLKAKAGELNLDSINKKISESPDSIKLENLLKTALEYSSSNPILSIEYAKASIALAEKNNKPRKKVQSLIIYGKALFNKGEYSNATDTFNESEIQTKKLNDSLSLVDIYQSYSLIFSKIGDFDKALNYSQKAFTLAGQLNQKQKLGELVRETGNIYFSFGESEIALDFYQKSLQICKEMNDEEGMSKALNNIGRIYSESGQYGKALESLNASLEIKIKHNNKQGIANTLLNIGTIYFKKNNYNEAIKYFKQSNINYQKVSYSEGISNSFQFLGRSYLKLKEYNLSKENLLKALEIAKFSRNKPLLVTIYLDLSELYASTKEFDRAYSSLHNYKVLNDSVFSDERRTLLMELDAKYNLRAKEKQISLLSKEQELQDTQRKKLAIWNILLGVITAFLIFIIYIVYSRMRFRDNLNRKLMEEIVQRKSAEEALHKYQEHLEAIVEDRTRDLKVAKDKAEESDMLKTAFLANMSHEIRTPMNAIVGFSNLLLDKDSTEEERLDYVKQINANSDVLMNLISDIIDISMIESGQLSIQKDEATIVDIINDIYKHYHQERYKFNREHIALKLKIEEKHKNFTIYTDIRRIKQILSNLVSNALKFTHEGEVTLGFKISNINRVIFYVSDTGIGIPPCNQSAIFERFNKFNSGPEPMLYSGTGIGLSISKELIQMLGGDIWFESVVNKGSTFYVSVPLSNKSKPMEAATLSKTANEIQESFSNKTILIAEDTVSNFKLIKAYLKEANVNLLWAKDGKEVLDLLDNNIVHLILMDIQMPLKDGIQTTVEIRNKNIKTPIIIQTAYTLNNEIEKSYQAGCNDYITKPIRKDEFLNKISKYL